MDTKDDLDLDSLMELLNDTSGALEEKTESKNDISENQEEMYKTQKQSRFLKDVPLDFSSGLLEKASANSFSTKKENFLHSEDNDMFDEENKLGLTEEGKNLEKRLNSSYNNSILPRQKVKTWKDTTKMGEIKGTGLLNSSAVDNFSGIRLVNPLISSDVMEKRMENRRMIKMSFIKNFIKGSDIEGDWVTIGVLINKIPPKVSKNGKTYSIWKMSDLHDCEKVISMFLFGAAHAEHWKTAIGTVMGFLNPSIMPDRDKNGEINLSTDHAGKIMVMGKSKDFGYCKGKRRDGTPCNAVVNLNQCEFCIYHVKKEYQKFSAKRSELQAVYSGREPSLKDKVLKKQNVFYGGQMFTQSEKFKTPSKQTSSKDKLTLLNLGLKRKAEVLENEEKKKGIKKLTELYGPEILSSAEKNSEFINNQLVIQNAGSKNLLQHMIKEKAKKDGVDVKVISPKELLKMRDNSCKNKKINSMQNTDLIIKNLTPQIGRGLQPGQVVNLDISSKKTKIFSGEDLAKLRAIQKIREKGPIKRQNPNAVKSSCDVSTKIKAVLDKSIDENLDYVSDEETEISQSRLGTINMNSDKIKKIFSRKSSHAYEVENAEIEKQETYFNVLEKKERMEEKMASITEIVCEVVSCKQCKYTAHQATDMCKDQKHPLKCHKAIKRFFACKNCKRRTCCFTKLPKRACRNCGESNYERTSMLKPRSGPKLDSETLNIRGEEIKFLNSLK